MQTQRSGFSLIELAIVVIIIAIVAGAIVSGRSLIRNAQMREVLAEYDRYTKAIGEFQLKYNQLPGDFTQAQTLWGAASVCPPAAGSATDKATCNGNGSGTIGDITDVATGAFGTTTTEWYYAWQHLANAGLIEGLYSGARGPSNGISAAVGRNTPASALSGGSWVLFYYQQTSNRADLWGDSYGHTLSFGAPPSVATNNANFYPVLTSSEALELENKADDGKPGRGKIRSWRTGTSSQGGQTPDCTTTDTSQDNATYNTSISTPACALLFILGL
jgi:prepilin-type N-terminal cleavage/methylation domain-containing protein